MRLTLFRFVVKLVCEGVRMYSTAWDELREIAWLASMISGLSLLGIGLAIALAVVI